MTYAVVFTQTAATMLRAIRDRREQALIKARIDELAQNPLQLGKPLTDELVGYRSIRAVGQRYRIIYVVDEEKLKIAVLAVGRRRAGNPNDIYEIVKRLQRQSRLDPLS